MRFLDTNVILRYLTEDDEAKRDAARALFQRARMGVEELVTSEALIAECVFILSSPRQPYQLNRDQIRQRLAPVLAVRGLNLPQREVCERALDIYVAYPMLDYEDALAVAHMETAAITEIVSYDRDFDRVPEVVRVEP